MKTIQLNRRRIPTAGSSKRLENMPDIPTMQESLPDIVKHDSEVGAITVGNSQEAMAAWMKEDTERWRAVIKAGGITVD